MKQKTIAILTALTASVCLSSAALADETFNTTSCLTGEPAQTVIEEGRSSVPTAPMISWEEQRANTRTWASDSARNPAPSGDKTPAPETPPTKPDVSAGAKPSTPTDKPSQPDDGHYITGSLTAQEQFMLNAINEERAANGVGALPIDMELTALAREKSADMVENRYFAHESPTYGKADQMLTDAGYSYTSVGENIARSGSAEKAHAALMSSANHRRNILGSQWTRVGIGIVNDANGYPYITQLFAR